MDGFKFSLEPVLSYQESLVESVQMELVALEQEANQARSVRDLLVAEMEQSNADRRALLDRGQLDVDALRRIDIYHEGLSARLKRQQVVVADVEDRVASKREELLKLQQDREILDELKRRQWRRYRQKLEQAEARLLDESAITSFNRRRMAALQPLRHLAVQPPTHPAIQRENSDVD